MNTPLRHSGTARVLKGSHSFTWTPRVHPLTEWTIPAFAFLAEASTHLPTPEGWKAELALYTRLRTTYKEKAWAAHHVITVLFIALFLLLLALSRYKKFSQRFSVVAHTVSQYCFQHCICNDVLSLDWTNHVKLSSSFCYVQRILCAFHARVIVPLLIQPLSLPHLNKRLYVIATVINADKVISRFLLIHSETGADLLVRPRGWQINHIVMFQ